MNLHTAKYPYYGLLNQSEVKQSRQHVYRFRTFAWYPTQVHRLSSGNYLNQKVELWLGIVAVSSGKVQWLLIRGRYWQKQNEAK